MTDTATQSAGWYTDPLGQDDLRWWDGRYWTTTVTASRATKPNPEATKSASRLQWAEEPAQVPQSDGETTRVSPPASTPLATPKFALGATPADAKTEPEADVSEGADWSPLMLALLNERDSIVTASAAGIPTMTIDLAGRTYWWDRSLDSFPSHPVDLVVTSTPRAQATMPAVTGRYSEPLLWRIGTASESVSKLVDPTLRYKLRRWPDLASLPHTADQLRAMTILTSARLTPAELAAIADVTERCARILIGTFSLMSLLESVKDPAPGR
jgi:hypothetical protein